MNRLCSWLCISTSFLVSIISSVAVGQAVVDSDEVRARMESFRVHQEMQQRSEFNKLPWQFVGPVTMTGRITDVDAHPSEPTTYYVASASGGVFKTTDEGKSWKPLFDRYPTISIGDLAIDPNNPKTVWVGTGEANIFRSSMAGIGIFKSTDGGENFEYMGLGDTQHIARVLVHPKNSDVVYVAAPGHEYTYNRERGVFKTTDGGKSWQHVFFKDNTTGAIDLAMDPANPDVLYLATAERLRYRWNDPKPGSQCALWKSTDGGVTWNLINRGLPNLAECERIGLDICATKPNVVYALVNNLAKSEGEGRRRDVVGADLYRSDDSGANWIRCEGSPKIGSIYASYGWVFGQVRVDPNNADIVYVLGVNLMRSEDGGKTFANVKGNHADYHALWFNPKDSNHIMVGNDGGFMFSHDGLKTFENPKNLPIAHMYNVAVSQEEGKFMAYTCIQDNMGWRGEIDLTGGRNAVKFTDWEGGYGDESGRQAVDPTEPSTVYAVNRYGTGPIRMDAKETDRRKRRKDISPDFGSDQRRAQWVSPIIISSHDPKRLLYGAQFVFLTNDRGDSWKRISPDLTNFDPTKQGNIAYSTMFSLAESPLKKGLIYAGTDDGNVQVTQDEGATWTKVSEGIPKDCFIASIEACRQNEGTVFIAVNGKRINDFKCYLFKSTDYGKSWQSITNNLPHSIANVLRQDPVNPDILYAGTDCGVYVSLDGGQKWSVLGSGLPTAYVHDIAFNNKEHVAVIATHGRSAWLIDLLPIRAAAQFSAPNQ